MIDDERIDGLSLDTVAAEQGKLRAIFPQCFVEGKLDERKLLALLGSFETPDAHERYEFRWKGKQECLQLAGKRSAGTLRPCRAESVDWENTRNVYIEGDNLEVLKLLQTSYYRKVKMIYIDPPYNTGNDFIYTDDFADPLVRYREVTQQTAKSNPESMGRFHTNWLNMMYPRLQLASNLLRDDGMIFISIDDNEVHNLRKLCDEVFGEENFVFSIVWRRSDNQPNIGNIAKVKEYIVCYAKNQPQMKMYKLPLTEKAKAEYRYEDKMGKFRRSILLHKTRGRHTYPITTKSGKTLHGPWMIKEEEFYRLDKENGIYWTSGGDEQPYGKIYLKDNAGQIPNDFWGIEFGTNQRASLEVEKLFDKRIFDFPKPVSLIQTLIKLGSQSDDIVLDFFSGSATTAHAVMQLNAEDDGNRCFILVQLPEVTDEKSQAAKAGYANICEIGKERIRRVGKELTSCPLGRKLNVGFRVFKLDSSNLKLWDNSPITGENALAELEARIYGMLDILKPDRSDEDVVYEVMLKLGQDLCAPITVIALPNDRCVYGVGAEAKFIVCIARDVTISDAQIVSKYAPERVVFADACFNNSTDKSNVKLCLRDKGITIRVL